MKYLREIIAGVMMMNGALFGYIVGHQYANKTPGIPIMQQLLTGTNDIQNRKSFSGNVFAVTGGLAGIVITLLGTHAIENIHSGKKSESEGNEC